MLFLYRANRIKALTIGHTTVKVGMITQGEVSQESSHPHHGMGPFFSCMPPRLTLHYQMWHDGEGKICAGLNVSMRHGSLYGDYFLISLYGVLFYFYCGLNISVGALS